MTIISKIKKVAVFSLSAIALHGVVYAQDKATTITMTSTFPPSIDLMDADKKFADTVNLLGKGSIKIKFLPGESLVPSTQVLDAVRSGSIDASGDWAGYWAGTDSAFGLIGAFPMLFTATDYLLWLQNWGGAALLDEVYGKYGIKYLPYSVLTSESGLRGSKPINTLDDLQGKRVRMSGQPQGEILKKFGASQVLIPGSEVYPALERGVFDAAEYSTPGTDWGMGLQEVTKYNSTPGWHQPGSVTGVMIDQKVWDKLNDHQKNILKVAADATMSWSLGHYEKGSAKAVKEFEKHGTVASVLSKEDMEKLQVVANEVLLNESCKNPLFAKLAVSQLEYLQDYAQWRTQQGQFAMGRNIEPFPDLAAIRECAK